MFIGIELCYTKMVFLPWKLSEMLALDSPRSLTAVHLYVPASSVAGSLKGKQTIYRFTYICLNLGINSQSEPLRDPDRCSPSNMLFIFNS